jgi:predicted site-specific integrase-resolvase
VLVDLDEHDLWDVAEAARRATKMRQRNLSPDAHVSPATIWKWVSRGHLAVAERRGRALRFAPLAVSRAEAKTRERARRTVAAA